MLRRHGFEARLLCLHPCCLACLQCIVELAVLLLQVETLLGSKLNSIYSSNASALRVLSVVGPEGFRLRDRALHVYSEAGRVYAFRDVCEVRLRQSTRHTVEGTCSVLPKCPLALSCTACSRL